ncbi:hypothetical protein NL329_31130, partial [Klebsiella pneumoniae]|nr:hypothetical protein [Klebsiella pneumoniae]
QFIAAYDLPAALGDVLGHLVLGKTPQAIADVRDVSVGTVRSQIVELRERTGTRRTTDLVRLVLTHR